MTKIAPFLFKPFWNIKKWTAWEEKCCLLISYISFRFKDIHVFKICKLAKWWRHTLNQILFRYDEKRYLSQFVSEIFEFLRKGSTKYAPQYELNNSVTIATYWVPDLPHIKSSSSHLWRSVLIFANSSSYAWSSKSINMLARLCGFV